MRVVFAGILLAGLFAGPLHAQTVQPYQRIGAVNSASCPNKQCTITFSAVPSGKRLMLQSVSAQVGAEIRNVTLEGNGISYFVAKPDPGNTYITAPVTLYYEAGSSPTARIYAGATTQNTSFIVVLVGSLVPAS